MEDRTCPKCNLFCHYPSKLKLHFEKSYHCKKSTEDINDYFLSLKNNIDIKCIDCNKSFSRKDSYNRHKRLNTCKLQQSHLGNNFLESLTPDQLKQIAKIINKKPTKTNISNIANTDNITMNTINSNTVTNNTINNNTIIQHINPFGFEDVRTIPISEMKTILNSGTEAGFHIIKSIYNKIENKNFYKPNISRSEVACLNEDLKLTIYNSKEFADAFFDRCIALLHHILYLCKNEFTSVSIKCIYDNIEYIETSMRTEIYEKKLQSIIETEFRNNNIDTKDRIKNFIKKIKEESVSKDNSLLLIKNTVALAEDKNNEYITSISNTEINTLLGDPKQILGLKKDELILNLKTSRFEQSIFYNFWIDRIKNIKKYILNNKKSTIGDIINLSKEENKISSMLDIIKRRVDNNKGDDFLDLNLNDEFRLDDIIIHELNSEPINSKDITEVDLKYISNLHNLDELI